MSFVCVGAASVYLWGFGTPVLIFLLTTGALRYAVWGERLENRAHCICGVAVRCNQCVEFS